MDVHKLHKYLKIGFSFIRSSLLGTHLSDRAFFRSLKIEPDSPLSLFQYFQKIESSKFFFANQFREEIVNYFRQNSPATEHVVVKAANKICRHVFDLLGSGPTKLGHKIDWHQDFKTGHRWIPHLYYALVRPAAYPGGYDIKVPWELSRCQHFIWLGQAYWFTEDEKYAYEFVSQVTDWIENNPPQWGVNWACTMDVSIRAVNWLWGYYFFKGSSAITPQFLTFFIKSLLIHGRHIMKNLERAKKFTNNHYLSNLAGLIYLGILLPEFKEAKMWREFGLSELEKEIFKQTTPDGVSFEASTSYHRLATELFLSPTLLAQLNGHSFSPEYMSRLEKMLEFIHQITKPDGTVPLFGDIDNGRLHRLKVWENPEREWTDYRYLLAIGAILFNREDFALSVEDQREESYWTYAHRALEYWEKTEATHEEITSEGAVFPDAGIGVLRTKNHYLAILAGPNGQNQVGGHAHNHTLSFEFFANGTTWILDPGTFCYTSDYDARNQFRSTAWHNTVYIDQEEINPIDPRHLFRLQDIAQARILNFKQDNQYGHIATRHDGYHRLQSPVTHYREILYKTVDPTQWWIKDRLDGTGEHQITVQFQLAPVTIQLTSPGCIMTNSTGHELSISFHSTPPLHIGLIKHQFSPSYGVGCPNYALLYSGMMTLPAEVTICLRSFTPKTPSIEVPISLRMSDHL